MESITLNASTRVRKGKNESRRLRKEGMVPAILYGSSQEKPVMLKLNQHDLHVLVNHTRGQNVLIDLTIEENADKVGATAAGIVGVATVAHMAASAIKRTQQKGDQE